MTTQRFYTDAESVKKYTAEELLSNKEIYKELRNLSGMDLVEAKECLLDRAKVLDIKMKVNNRIKESNKTQHNTLSNTINIDGNKYKTNNWFYSEEMGIYKPTKDSFVIACSHLIWIEQEYRDAETGECKVLLKFKKRGRVHSLQVQKSTIASASKIVSLAEKGVEVTSENARHLVSYLSELSSLNDNIIEEIVSTSKCGWKQDNEFVPFSEYYQVDVDENQNAIIKSLVTKGDEQTNLDLLKKIRATGKQEILVYIGAALSSVLTKPCGALPYMVSLYGTSGKGKTVLLKVVTSLFGDPEHGLISDAKATLTAQEVRLDMLDSLPYFLDDLSQINSKLKGDYAEFIYKVCQGQGVERSNVNLGLRKQTTWKNCILTTAENSLLTDSMSGGAINRVIDIGITEALFDDEGELSGHDICAVLKDNYGFVARKFIDEVQKLGFDNIEKLRQEFESRLNNRCKELGVKKEGKQLLPASLIVTADYIATNLIFGDEVLIDIDYMLGLLHDAGSINDQERAYEYLCNKVMANSFRFNDENDGNIERWGKFIGDDKVAILPSEFNRILGEQNFNAKTFKEQAVKRGWLETKRKNGRYTVPTKLGDKVMDCYRLLLPENKFVDVDGIENPFDIK